MRDARRYHPQLSQTRIYVLILILIPPLYACIPLRVVRVRVLASSLAAGGDDRRGYDTERHGERHVRGDEPDKGRVRHGHRDGHRHGKCGGGRLDRWERRGEGGLGCGVHTLGGLGRQVREGTRSDEGEDGRVEHGVCDPLGVRGREDGLGAVAVGNEDGARGGDLTIGIASMVPEAVTHARDQSWVPRNLAHQNV